MPLESASIGLSATARIALPVMVSARKTNSIAIATAAMIAFSTCCGPTCRKPKLQSRRSGIAKSRGRPPKKKRIVLSIIRLSAIDAIASVSAL